MFRSAPPPVPAGPAATPCCQDAQSAFRGLETALAGVYYAMAAVWTALIGVAARWRSLARCAGAWASHGAARTFAAVANAPWVQAALAEARGAWAKAAASEALKPAFEAAAAASAAASAAAARLSTAAAPHLAAAAPFAPHAGAAAALLAFLVYSPPVLLARAAQRATGAVFDCTFFAPPRGAAGRRGRPRRKYVALTIDDGPCPFTTGHILNALRAHGARATMFVIGSHVEEIDRLGADGAALGRQTLKNIAVAGHELANHTM
jgi:hypothetical protein